MHSRSSVSDCGRLEGCEGPDRDKDPVVISDTIQEFDGRRYYFCGGRYYRAKGKLLHRAVWEKNCGPVPDGWHVHHKDRNRHNNAIENLDCLPSFAHQSGEHGAEHGARGKLSIKQAAVSARVWHGSDAGKRWHQKQYDKHCAPALFKEREVPCRQCGNTATVRNYNGAFCSNKCKSAWRRAAGLDNEQRTCAVCNKTFKANKYTKIKTCSRACGAISSARSRSGVSQRKRGRKG